MLFLLIILDFCLFDLIPRTITINKLKFTNNKTANGTNTDISSSIELSQHLKLKNSSYILKLLILIKQKKLYILLLKLKYFIGKVEENVVAITMMPDIT